MQTLKHIKFEIWFIVWCCLNAEIYAESFGLCCCLGSLVSHLILLFDKFGSLCFRLLVRRYTSHRTIFRHYFVYSCVFWAFSASSCHISLFTKKDIILLLTVMKYVVYSILLRFDASCFLLPLLSKKQKGNKLFIPEKKDNEVLFLNNTILLLFFCIQKR